MCCRSGPSDDGSAARANIIEDVPIVRHGLKLLLDGFGQGRLIRGKSRSRAAARPDRRSGTSEHNRTDDATPCPILRRPTTKLTCPARVSELRSPRTDVAGRVRCRRLVRPTFVGPRATQLPTYTNWSFNRAVCCSHSSNSWGYGFSTAPYRFSRLTIRRVRAMSGM